MLNCSNIYLLITLARINNEKYLKQLFISISVNLNIYKKMIKIKSCIC